MDGNFVVTDNEKSVDAHIMPNFIDDVFPKRGTSNRRRRAVEIESSARQHRTDNRKRMRVCNWSASGHAEVQILGSMDNICRHYDLVLSSRTCKDFQWSRHYRLNYQDGKVILETSSIHP
ncbi:hypothetical protein AVEN_93538-1 [Araneus ventricosus]|uniref:Uncharacterized protein n=1 Tax=Araneus ventricosus TaxID=182803 RepID=A0A4Y2AR98_ARAVE|nr:hypothetical protein AVEN_93538-1 [Araneus ventricosus]